MATYAIGDIQGCFKPFMELLELISFNPQHDKLWLTGDIINRGKDSLKTLRFIYNLGDKCNFVLGNHDLHLIGTYYKARDFKAMDTIQEVIAAHDADDLILWLTTKPLLYYDRDYDYVMAHAGIYPLWDYQQAQLYAEEFADFMRNADLTKEIGIIFGPTECAWSNNFTGDKRLRFIVNAFTRMRYCKVDDCALELHTKTADATEIPAQNLVAWFKHPQRIKQPKIIFGHWAALRGKVDALDVFALDSGCNWGGELTAFNLDSQQRFHVTCSEYTST